MPPRPLAQVEWQLIMRMCDLRSLLALARCTHSTLAAASSEFAWGALSPVTFRSTRRELGKSIRGSLVRFAPSIGVRWIGADPVGLQRGPETSELTTIASVPRLALLDASGRMGLESIHLNCLLQRPRDPLSNLTALHTQAGIVDAEALVRLKTHCPRLNTLQGVLVNGGVFGRRCMTALAQLPSLTDLFVEVSFADATVWDFFTSADAVTRLRKLTLYQRIGAFHPMFLAAPRMASLQELTFVEMSLVAWLPVATDVIDWAACFTNLVALRSLTLVQCASSYSLLVALASPACAPQLSTLHIRVWDYSFPLQVAATHAFTRPRSGPAAPSAPALEQILSVRPGLALTLETPTLQAHIASIPLIRDYVEEVHVGQWQRAQDGYLALQACYPNRVRLLANDAAAKVVLADDF